MCILKATWEITGRCNAKCPHCYASGISGILSLSTSDIKMLIQRLYAGGVRFLTFSGGEPCLSENLIRGLSEAFSLGMNCSIITNGTVEHGFVIEACNKGLLKVIVSILAGDERGFEKCYGLSTQFFKKQRSFLKEINRFSVNIPLFSANTSPSHIQNLAEYISLFKNNIADVSVFPSSPLGRGFSDESVLDHHNLNLAKLDLVGRLARVGIHADFSEDCLSKICCPLTETESPGQIFIDPKGRIRPCHGLIGSQSKNSLKEMSLEGILSAEVIGAWRGDPRFIFDSRCKAILLRMGFPPSYVKQSGGRRWLHLIQPKAPDDVVVEHRADCHVVYRSSIGTHVELNDDGLELFENCRKNGYGRTLSVLDNQEIEDSIEVLNVLFESGLLEMSWAP